MPNNSGYWQDQIRRRIQERGRWQANQEIKKEEKVQGSYS